MSGVLISFYDSKKVEQLDTSKSRGSQSLFHFIIIIIINMYIYFYKNASANMFECREVIRSILASVREA